MTEPVADVIVFFSTYRAVLVDADRRFVCHVWVGSGTLPVLRLRMQRYMTGLRRNDNFGTFIVHAFRQ